MAGAPMAPAAGEPQPHDVSQQSHSLWRHRFANSRENQLTPWSNDPVSDPVGEALYVRDEESGVLWGPTVLPIREDASPYVARHGQGYSRFEHAAHGVTFELLMFVPVADPIKISRLTLVNRDDRPRRLSVTAYAEWVLGASRGATAPFVVTEIDAATGAMLARNGLPSGEKNSSDCYSPSTMPSNLNEPHSKRRPGGVSRFGSASERCGFMK